MSDSQKIYVVCAGTSNIDVQGFAGSQVVLNDKNPGGHIEVWAGGVARNIAENLARLGQPVKMLTAVGDDIHADKIMTDSTQAGMDMSEVLILKNTNSAAYVSITDPGGDLVVGLTDMSIASHLTLDYFISKRSVLETARAIVLSPCISAEVIAYLHENFDAPIFMDVVANGYVENILKVIHVFYTIKANQYEAEALSGVAINGENDLHKAADNVLSMGALRFVITLGKDGVFYKNQQGVSMRSKTREMTDVVNATGAGDAFTAGLVYGYINNMDLRSTLDFSMAAAGLTLAHQNTINPHINPALVAEKTQEWKL
jgi:pseudouridine kinase